jgi:O-Antigen ligase
MKKWALPILIVTILMGQVVRVPTELVRFKSVAILPNDLALVGLAILLLVRKLKLRRLFLQNGFLTRPLIVFVLVAVVSLLINANYYNLHTYEVEVSGLYFARWISYCVTYFLVLDLVTTREQLKTLVGWLAAAVLLFAAFGIIQAIFLPNFAFTVHPEAGALDWDMQRNRLVSTFLDPNFAGCFLGIGLAFAIEFMVRGYRRAWLAVALLGAALLLTYSRGAIIAFLAALLYLIVTGEHKRRALAAVSVILLVAVVGAPYFLPHAEDYARFGFSDQSAQYRFQALQQCTELIRDNFFFGIGFDTVPYVTPHHYGYDAVGAGAFGLQGGGILFIFALTGAVGFSVYTYLLGKAAWKGHALAQESKDRLLAVLGRGCLSATIILVISAFSTSNFTYAFLMEFLWLLLGALNVACLLQRRSASVRTQKVVARPVVAKVASVLQPIGTVR